MADITIEEFRALPEATGRRSIVPWDDFMEEVKGKIITIDDVKKFVMQYKEKFNYSEWYRILKRFEKEGVSVEVRKGEDGTTYYGIGLE